MYPSVSLRASLALLLALVSVCHSASPEFLSRLKRQETETPQYVPQICAGQVFACESCNSYKFCLEKTGETPTETKCPSLKPYCHKNSGSPTGASCEATPEDEKMCPLNSADPDFTCTGVGYFPNPETCNSFYYCEAQGQPGNIYNCATGYQYNTKTHECYRNIRGACPTATCNEQKMFNPYPLSNSYYIYCQYDRTSTPPKVLKKHILSCGEGSTYNDAAQVCEFRCSREGQFVNTANPKQYFQCYREGLQWRVAIRNCQDDYIFDNKQNRCVSKSAMTRDAMLDELDNEAAAKAAAVPAVDVVAPRKTDCLSFITNLMQRSSGGV